VTERDRFSPAALAPAWTTLRIWRIEPLHDHVRMEPAGEFEMILAQAAADQLGAYSRSHDLASPGGASACNMTLCSNLVLQVLAS
jgi:hypothetical protein